MSAAERGLRRTVVGATVLVAGALALLPPPADALEPTPGVATVDGSPAEWTAADDVAALVGNDPPHLEVGRVSLRYDCADEVLFALVTAGPGHRLQTIDPDEAYVRLGSDPKLVSGEDGADGTAPDAAWVDAQGGTAAGIEMSAPLGPGPHDELRIHAKLPDDSEDGYETVDLAPRFQQLVTACPAAAAAAQVALADPPAAADDGAVESDGLARTGAPILALATIGGLLLAVGAGLTIRRRARPAGP